jgi:hypothetical protein
MIHDNLDNMWWIVSHGSSNNVLGDSKMREIEPLTRDDYSVSIPPSVWAVVGTVALLLLTLELTPVGLSIKAALGIESSPIIRAEITNI